MACQLIPVLLQGVMLSSYGISEIAQMLGLPSEYWAAVLLRLREAQLELVAGRHVAVHSHLRQTCLGTANVHPVAQGDVHLL